VRKVGIKVGKRYFSRSKPKIVTLVCGVNHKFLFSLACVSSICLYSRKKRLAFEGIRLQDYSFEIELDLIKRFDKKLFGETSSEYFY
jgi:hypothetical protein